MSKDKAPKAPPAQPQFTEVKCTVELANAILSYLQQQPYAGVAQLMEQVKTGFSAVPPVKEPPAKRPVPWA